MQWPDSKDLPIYYLAVVKLSHLSQSAISVIGVKENKIYTSLNHNYYTYSMLNCIKRNAFETCMQYLCLI